MITEKQFLLMCNREPHSKESYPLSLFLCEEGYTQKLKHLLPIDSGVHTYANEGLPTYPTKKHYYHTPDSVDIGTSDCE